MTEQKHALVTGVTSGLGAYVATALARDGWRVTGIGRKLPDHPNVPRGIGYERVDLAQPDEVATLHERITDAPDLVAHCAAAYPAAQGRAPGAMEGVFQVNAFAPYKLTLGLLERQPSDQFMSVIIVNSEAIYNADEKSGVYAASKAALHVLASSLAHDCRGRNASIAALLLGPLADDKKRSEINALATRRCVDAADMTRLFLRRSNPNLVIDDFIEFESCLTCIRAIYVLGKAANGMVCRLDGGAGGSLP